MRIVVTLLVMLPALAFPQAHASMNSITLPTWQEGLPDTNPPFDQFQVISDGLGIDGQKWPYVYPYTMRTNFIPAETNVTWRTISLENEYLSCSIFPDLGGHLYSCVDKLTGRGMFYDNGSIKKQWVGLRGSRVALGMELNFPHGT
jgi:hypothetical protein